MIEEKDDKKQKRQQRLDVAQWIYWMMVVAAAAFVFGVVYGSSNDDAEKRPLTLPGEAERQPIHITIVHDCPTAETPPSASQGV
jgi:hypothetical protein